MNKLFLFGIAVLTAILVFASYSLELFAGLENFFEDSLVSPKSVNKDLLIVAIDDESMQKIGQWPWPREIFAKALLEIERNQPQVVGVDVIFPEPSRAGSKDDSYFSEALKKIKYPVVLPVEARQLVIKNESVQAENFLEPLPQFTEGENVVLGHVNLILDSDGVARRLPVKAGFYNSFAYEIAVAAGFKIDNLKNLERIVYSAPAGAIRRVPFWRVLDGSVGEILENKIILIGATAADLHDEKLTPFSRGAEMPGVEIQANAVNMLLSGYRLAPLSSAVSFAWFVIAALIPAAAFLVFRGVLMPVFICAAAAVFYIILIAAFYELGIAANIIHVNLAWFVSAASSFIYRHFAAEKEKREMRNLFSKYVSKDVLENILRDPGKVSLGGEEKEITVLFSDIRDFTAFSEKTTPKELVAVLNRYFNLMTGQILENKGVLDKYIGDALMAFWGAPLDDPAHAENALKAALGMAEKLKELNEELKEKGEPEIHIGIGLYTGPAIVGNVGSDLRFDYTAIGDTVNIASRLEGLNKEYKTQIIMGESVKNEIKREYNFKFLGSVSVRGRKEPLKIYTLWIPLETTKLC